MLLPLSLTLRGRRFSCLVPQGPGRPVLALHGHFGRGSLFGPLATALAPRYGLVAPDQRGHGLSEHGGPFTVEEYVEDAAALLAALGLGPVPVLGHSMGALVAYCLAARHPDLVSALVVEDMGTITGPPEVAHPVLDVGDWPRRAADRTELRARIEGRGVPDAGYFLQSAVEDAAGCRLLFDPAEMMESQGALVGDFRDRWTASACPALLLRGGDSPMLSAARAREMVASRPGTVLREFPGCGHWIHDDDPTGFAEAVGGFLDSLGPRVAASASPG